MDIACLPGTGILSRSFVGCMKWQEDADGGAVLLRFAITLDADPPPVPLNELLCDEQANSCADRSPRREEGVKNPGQILRSDSHPIVSNCQDNAIFRA